MPKLQVVTFHESADGAAGVVEGRMEVARLPAWQHNDTDVYLCGPLGFMQAQWRDLLSAACRRPACGAKCSALKRSSICCKRGPA